MVLRSTQPGFLWSTPTVRPRTRDALKGRRTYTRETNGPGTSPYYILGFQLLLEKDVIGSRGSGKRALHVPSKKPIRWRP